MAAGGLCIDKLDKCKPQHPIVNRVFKSTRARKNNGGLQASSYEITGAVNNFNARASGQFNQSTFDRCQITVQMNHPSTDKQQANNKLGSSDGLAS
ncbi:hypothetical protein L6164_011001 [Bauhinia variegata]|nr:hypothetical protein L6164_011001 [Bauhinia variegata]